MLRFPSHATKTKTHWSLPNKLTKHHEDHQRQWLGQRRRVASKLHRMPFNSNLREALWSHPTKRLKPILGALLCFRNWALTSCQDWRPMMIHKWLLFTLGHPSFESTTVWLPAIIIWREAIPLTLLMTKNLDAYSLWNQSSLKLQFHAGLVLCLVKIIES